jgi:hypothetical protein
MVVCQDCDFAGESFQLGLHGEGRELAVEAWDALSRQMTLQEAADQLEDDMRRYLYDKMPDRRIACLERYRKRLGLVPWSEAQAEKVK